MRDPINRTFATALMNAIVVHGFENDADAAKVIESQRAGIESLIRQHMDYCFSLRHFSAKNRARCEAPNGFNHPLSDWSLSDWMTAILGELGEAANNVKKLNRYRDGIPGNEETEEELRVMLADEIADTFIYLDLIAQAARIDLPSAVVAKWEATSLKIGYK